MTIELTTLATDLETQANKLIEEGMDLATAWGFTLGYRQALAQRGLLGDIEDDALCRHFETWHARLALAKPEKAPAIAGA